MIEEGRLSVTGPLLEILKAVTARYSSGQRRCLFIGPPSAPHPFLGDHCLEARSCCISFITWVVQDGLQAHATQACLRQHHPWWCSLVKPAEQRVPVIPHQKLDAFVWGSRRRSAPAGAPKSDEFSASKSQESRGLGTR